MSAPIMCPECTDMIGELDGMALLGTFGQYRGAYGPCPGRGKHVRPEIRKRQRWFGLTREEQWHWPETMTTSEWRRVKQFSKDPEPPESGT